MIFFTSSFNATESTFSCSVPAYYQNVILNVPTPRQLISLGPRIMIFILFISCLMFYYFPFCRIVCTLSQRSLCTQSLDGKLYPTKLACLSDETLTQVLFSFPFVCSRDHSLLRGYIMVDCQSLSGQCP